jgi:hypothetical protein
MVSRRCRLPIRRPSCRNIRSQTAPVMAICGRPDIGAMLLRATIGCRAPGRGRRKWATCGRRDIGDLSAARYHYHYGFWGRHIGYYGGVNYGFGYVGVGYQGGYWNGDRFNYNRSVNNVTITNVQVYNRTITNTVVINNVTVNITNNRSSYNGPGGVTRKPLPTEVAATREQRIPPMTRSCRRGRRRHRTTSSLPRSIKVVRQFSCSGEADCRRQANRADSSGSPCARPATGAERATESLRTGSRSHCCS